MMLLQDYEIDGVKNLPIQKEIAFEKNTILLFALDRTVLPPEDGRKNIISLDGENTICWIAELPTAVYDSYNDMWMEGDVLCARSSNSYIAEIDPKSGKIHKKYMIK